MKSKALRINLDPTQSVAALVNTPPKPVACFVMAHGAGAGMDHPFMARVAAGLYERNIATLRYQFAYMERGSKRPDRPALAHAAVRAAVTRAAKVFPDVPLFAGGKSFGARMSSQAQAAQPLTNVRGLAFFGFPLHSAGSPSAVRAAHLADVAVPMLFLQGGRDKLADLALLLPVVRALGKRATLCVFENADHSFHVPVRSGQTDGQVMNELLDTMADWVNTFKVNVATPLPRRLSKIS
jgi:predicted alpha/beta-hydrolase family hydrolase